MAKLKNKKRNGLGNGLIPFIDFISKTDQEKMKIAKNLLYPLIKLLNIGLKYVAKKQTPYQYAVEQMVKRAFSSTGQKHEFFIDLHELIFSRGSLPNAQVEEVTFHDHMCEILMSDNSGEGDARPDDISRVLFFNFSKQEFAYYLQGYTRSTALCPYELPERWAGDRINVFIAMYSADKKLVSDSEYLGDYISQ